MPIEQIEAWQYRGRVFTAKAKAEDFAEELVGMEIKQELLDKGFTLSQWFKVTETLIKHRSALAELLSY